MEVKRQFIMAVTHGNRALSLYLRSTSTRTKGCVRGIIIFSRHVKYVSLYLRTEP